MRKGPFNHPENCYTRKITNLLAQALRNFKIEVDRHVEAASPPLTYFSILLTKLRFLSKEIEVANELQSGEPVAYGEVRRPAKPEDSSEGDTLEGKPTYWENRTLLKQALMESYEHGLLLRQGKPNEEAIKKWAERIYGLVRSALGEKEPLLFLVRLAEGEDVLATPGRTKEEIMLDTHLNHLSELIQRVDSLEPLELQSGFDGREWVSKR